MIDLFVQSIKISTPGYQGPRGPAGENGINGSDGAPGLPGDDGLSAYQIAINSGFIGTEIEWLASLQGPQGVPGLDGVAGPAGEDGTPGAVWRTGADAPSNGLGIDGDYYLHNGTGDVYYKNTGTYSVVANITGPTGNIGPSGADGAPGIAGPGLPIGGTIGQVIRKASSTDYDTVWGAEAAGGTGEIQYALSTGAQGSRAGNTIDNSTGIVSAPGYTVTGATIPVNGIYLGATNQLNLSTNSVSRFSLSATGNVTIGSTSMASGLGVNTNVNGGISLTSNNTLGPGFNLNSSTGRSFQFFVTGSGNNAGNFGVYSITRNSTPFSVYDGSSGTAGAMVKTSSTGVIGFSNSSSSAAQTCDTGISRISAGVFAFGSGVAANVSGEMRHGNTKCMTAGDGVYIKEGANATMGQATLVAGTVTISNTKATATCRVFLSVETPGGTQGFLSYSKVAGASFTINSTSSSDTSVVNWLIVEQA